MYNIPARSIFQPLFIKADSHRLMSQCVCVCACVALRPPKTKVTRPTKGGTVMRKRIPIDSGQCGNRQNGMFVDKAHGPPNRRSGQQRRRTGIRGMRTVATVPVIHHASVTRRAPHTIFFFRFGPRLGLGGCCEWLCLCECVCSSADGSRSENVLLLESLS